VAQCAEAKLSLRDPNGQEFVLLGDQTLSNVGVGHSWASGAAGEPTSPRCFMPAVAYRIPGLEEAAPPADALPPRLFIIYGNGEAEELISESDGLEALQVAKSDPQATVIEGEVMPPPLEGCRCHTIFISRVLDGSKPGAGVSTESVSLSLGSIDLSLGSLPQSPTQGPPPTITKFRQLIQYPPISEDNHQKFLGTLKQYRAWEQVELTKNREIMAVEDKKKGADKKGKKGPAKEDKKSKKKGKRQSVEAAPVEVVEVVLPKFVEDLNLNVYDHGVEVLRIRQALAPEPTDQELLTQALAGLEADASPTKEGFADLTNLPLNIASPDTKAEGAGNVAEGSLSGSQPLPPPSVAPPAEKPKQPKPEKREVPQMRSLPLADGNETKGATRPSRPKVADGPTFRYFQSDSGLQFLLDEGELDPESRPPIRKEKVSRNYQSPKVKRSPWNPLLLGEMGEGEAQDGLEDQVEQVQEARDGQEQELRWQAGEDPGADAQGPTDGMGGDAFSPQARLPIVAEDTDTPAGPHPDKKGNLWDIYGQPRQQRPVASHAYVMLNTEFLEVEGATDRRVRTSSIAHKKNAGKAPSVSSVRKTGQHALCTGTEIAAKEILGELGMSNPEEHWKLTSSMQGLGDSNSLVEVTPGICRFGPVRQGGVYRMGFFLRNLDVDVTRFNVTPLKSEFVKVSHQPGQIAPGMAAKVVVEIMAKQPGKVEQLVEVRVKAHVIRVPVTARILEAEEYDRLDAESMALHRRHIGRHREKSDAGEKRAVEVVTDEKYCRKVLGETNYRPQPADFEETPLH